MPVVREKEREKHGERERKSKGEPPGSIQARESGAVRTEHPTAGHDFPWQDSEGLGRTRKDSEGLGSSDLPPRGFAGRT